MYPNLFLSNFWSMDIRPEVFVAMSFADIYKSRYADVIAPAIESLEVDGSRLKPFRVDQSKTGDSILSEIVDGIAHCQLFVADVSTVGHDSKTGDAFRNGNVMYEVGLALAARQSSEVLLIRDDRDRFLFDVSTIPHMQLDFTDAVKARAALGDELQKRLDERDLINDARVRRAVTSLSHEEIDLLRSLTIRTPRVTFTVGPKGFGLRAMEGVNRLLDKHVIATSTVYDDGQPGYRLTPLGCAVASRLGPAPADQSRTSETAPSHMEDDSGTDPASRAPEG